MRNARRGLRSTFKALAAAGLAIAVAVVLVPAQRVAASSDVWSGAGGNNLLSTPGNWVGGVAPTATQSLDFPAGSAASLVDDLGVGFAITGLTFDDAGYHITPSTTDTFILTGGITSTGIGAGNSSVTVPIQITANTTITLNDSSMGISLGAVSESGGARSIAITGTGVLTFNVADTFTGGVSITGGATVDGPTAGGLGTGPVSINSGTLNLGNAGPTTWSNNITMSGSGGFIQTIGPGAVTLAGTMAINASTTFASNTNINLAGPGRSRVPGRWGHMGQRPSTAPRPTHTSAPGRSTTVR